MEPTISLFTGVHAFLSNFHSHSLTYEGITYPSSENAYQAQKVRPELRAACPGWTQHQDCSPGESKKLGRKLPMRPDWEHVKRNVMIGVCITKFCDLHLMKQLEATGNAKLVEGNHWGDIYWGVCNGKGENWLGRILMAIRQWQRDPRPIMSRYYLDLAARGLEHSLTNSILAAAIGPLHD